MSNTTGVAPARSASQSHPVLRVARILALVYLFLLGIHVLGEGFTLLGQGLLDSFFKATENPFFALMVGIFATSIVQSSSLTTSLIVGLVGAPDNPLPLANAIPMVMGANFGTTVTNTVVALAHIGRKDEFERAFAVSTCDDFFNFFAVCLLLPVEIATGILAKSASSLADFFTAGAGLDYESPVKTALEVGYAAPAALAETVFSSARAQGFLLALVACGLIFFALISLVKTMRRSVEARVEGFIVKAFEQSAFVAIGMGLVATVMVQSSSITTSLLVPLAGAGLLTLDRAFPVVLGANVGTTVTAMMAAVAATGPNARAGIAIALVHFLFNFSGILLLFPIPAIRRIPLSASRRLAQVGIRSAPLAIGYVIALFYGVPAIFAAINHLYFR